MSQYRSLDEFHDNDEYRRWAEREFPDFGTSRSNRRDFLKVVGASLAAAGLVSCRRADTRIVPYGENPPELVPGQPLYYASTFVLSGRAIGVLAETHVGRPIKLEGNPNHPASGGKLDAFGQAAL
ncbi:MAG: TAT-variant-translocated molybdopterin oxidoreductase, partial [Planctomycetota bacterium]